MKWNLIYFFQILRDFDVRLDGEDRHHNRTFRISHIRIVDMSEKSKQVNAVILNQGSAKPLRAIGICD